MSNPSVKIVLVAGLLWLFIASPVLAQEPMVGEIRMWASDTPPPGWKICNGAGLLQSEYPELFSVIGLTYGVWVHPEYGFIIPDLRGRVPVGLGATDSEFDTLGETGGEKTHTLTINEMPAHNHQYIDRSNSLRTDVDFHTTAGAGNGIAAGSGGTIVNRSPFIRNTGGGQPHNNLQPYQVIHYIIYTGVGLPTPTPTATPTVTATPTATATPGSGGPTGSITGTMNLPIIINQSSQHAYTTTLQTGNSFALIRSASYGEIVAGSGALLASVLVMFFMVQRFTTTK